MSVQKPLILVSNDDGITSKGIRTLIELMSQIGDVVVVAPDSPQSGMGHAITVGEPLRLHSSPIFGDISAYECSGTPADCVKLAKHWVLKDRNIDLVVSGINHGSNSSISVLYSGTMSAAIEAAIEGIPAIGFSLSDFSPNADFSHIKPFILQIAQSVLANGLPLNQIRPFKASKYAVRPMASGKKNLKNAKTPTGAVIFGWQGILSISTKAQKALANGHWRTTTPRSCRVNTI